MDEKRLYKLIRERDIEVFVNNFELGLSNAGITGANIHDSIDLKNYFKSLKGICEESNVFTQKNFEEFSKEYPEYYKEISDKILVAVNKFGMKV